MLFDTPYPESWAVIQWTLRWILWCASLGCFLSSVWCSCSRGHRNRSRQTTRFKKYIILTPKKIKQYINKYISCAPLSNYWNWEAEPNHTVQLNTRVISIIINQSINKEQLSFQTKSIQKFTTSKTTVSMASMLFN